MIGTIWHGYQAFCVGYATTMFVGHFFIWLIDRNAR